jgi:enoyl-CoA hydratase
MNSIQTSTDPEASVLLVEEDAGIVLATLNRPQKANALSRPLIAALGDLVAHVEDGWWDGHRVRCLVLTANGGRAFSAGADITELDGIGPGAAVRQMHDGQQVFSRLENLPVPVISAIDGVALGGGLELAMATDLRVASPRARFGQAEITLENLPGWGGTQRLVTIVGRARATEMILTGRVIDAAEAAAIGLVNEVADDPLRRALDLARTIADRSPVAIAGAKRAILAGIYGGIDYGLRVEADAVGECCATVEQRTAVREFLSRRTK